jgi:hypothetical protein
MLPEQIKVLKGDNSVTALSMFYVYILVLPRLAVSSFVES